MATTPVLSVYTALPEEEKAPKRTTRDRGKAVRGLMMSCSQYPHAWIPAKQAELVTEAGKRCLTEAEREKRGGP